MEYGQLRETLLNHIIFFIEQLRGDIMNLLSCLTYSVFLLSYSTAMEPHSVNSSKAINKRESTELMPPQPSKKHQKTYFILEEEKLEKMKERLEDKATILAEVLPKLKENLQVIQATLVNLAREKNSSHPLRASELASYATGIMVMVNSTDQFLHKLKSRNYDNKDDLVSVSMAILASGTLPAKIDTLTKFLSQSEETQDVDYRALTQAYQEIYKITEDLPNPVISKRK